MKTTTTGEQALAAALRHVIEQNATIADLEDRIDALEAKVKVRSAILSAISASAVQEPTHADVEQLQRDLQAAEAHIAILNIDVAILTEANADLEAALHGRLIASKN